MSLFGAGRAYCWLLFLCVVVRVLPAQDKPAEKNPLAGQPAAIAEGRAIFRFTCSACHGVDARGGLRAPNLTSGTFAHGGSDSSVFNTILHGVPGTLMPANDLTDNETWQVIAWLRSLESKNDAVAGDPDRGHAIFVGDGNCSSCHMVFGKGGRLGPDLSRVGAARGTQYLRESVRQPSQYIAEGITEPNKDLAQRYQQVTAITLDGQRITGVVLNEDTFSLQMIDQQEKVHAFLKSELREVVEPKKSLMPAYAPDVLSDRDLDDLLAYLHTLRGQQP